jgi:outer membrane protein
MRQMRSTIAAIAGAVALLGQPAMAQDRAFAFSLTGGMSVSPSYFGSDSLSLSPYGRFGFHGLRLGGMGVGDADSTDLFAPGTGVAGALRFIGKRHGRDELAGLDDISAALELGLRLHHTTRSWQVYGELRHGVVGHGAFVGEVGANAIFRSQGGLVVHAGPRADYGDSRFMRTYFGVTPAEAARSGLAAYRPGGGLQSVGLEIGAYQPLNAEWGITGSVRYDRLQRGAAASPIVQQGSRDQFSATIGLTRHFNFRF